MDHKVIAASIELSEQTLHTLHIFREHALPKNRIFQMLDTRMSAYLEKQRNSGEQIRYSPEEFAVGPQTDLFSLNDRYIIQAKEELFDLYYNWPKPPTHAEANRALKRNLVMYFMTHFLAQPGSKEEIEQALQQELDAYINT